MRKKILLIITVACAVCMSVLALAACGDKETRSHEHRLFDFEAQEATCISEGNVAYQECLYCRKKLVDGHEVSDEDITIPVAENNHAALTDVAAVPAKCVEEGMSAHKECEDCHKLFSGDKEVQKESLIIPAKGSHTFAAGKLECSECDAYKLLFDGEYRIIDATNYIPFVTNPLGISYSSTNKETYINGNFANRKSISTQVNTGITAENKDGKEYILKRTNGALSCFTRFAYGEGSEAYIGRLLVTFDFVVATDAEVQRVGVKVVDRTATVYSGVQQAKLLGTNAAEENNPNRKLEVGKKYRFAYEAELTEAEQLIQIFTVFGGKSQTATISNLHVAELEGKTGRLGSVLCKFGAADEAPSEKETCTHDWKYSVTAVGATCRSEGVVAHDWCPQCGRREIGGTEVTADDTTIAMTDHNYGDLQAAVESTCEKQGHDAYYQCSSCEKYFDENKTEIDGVPLKELVAHIGDWKSNVDKHWRHCEVCDKDVDESAHIPGAPATQTTPQTCTVCGFVIVPMLSHKHTPGAQVAAKDATCTENGNVAYYRCSDPECGKYFSDAECTKEISDVFLSKLGHSMSSQVAAKDATCTEDGNLAYYHCPTCGKYFEDADGAVDITESYMIEKKGHTMARYEIVAATCYKWGVKTAHSFCGDCNKYFTANDGATELTEEQIAELYDKNTPEHNFVGDVCSNDGCGAKRETSVIVPCGDNAFGTQGSTITPELVANPGTWSCQGSGSGSTGVTAKIEDGKLLIAAGAHTSSTRSGFVRTLPKKDDGTAFVGTWVLTFDFKVTSAANNPETVVLKLGYFLASTTGGNMLSVADEDVTLTVGKTYRFSVLVETTEDNQFVQLNVRNAPKSGLKNIEISNASYTYYPEAANFNGIRLQSLVFAEEVNAPADTSRALMSAQPALVPEKYCVA